MILFIIYLFVFLHLFSITWCYDELKRKYMFGNDFEENLIKENPKAFFQNSSNEQFIEKNNNSKYIKQPHETAVVTKTEEIVEMDLMNRFPTEYILELKEEMASEGVLKINRLGHKMILCVNKTKDFHIYPIIEKVSRNYCLKLNHCFSVMFKQNAKSVIDREFHILNIIELSNNIFYEECKRLWNNIMIFTNNSVWEEEANCTILEEIQKYAIYEKIYNLNYICRTLDICRPFPAYSDHVAELLYVILNLNDKNFKIILNEFKEIVELKDSFFKTIMDDDSAYKIGIKLKNILLDVTEGRRFLSNLIFIISHRLKIFKSTDGQIKIKTKALRMLIDMVDSTFQVLDKDHIEMELNNVKTKLEAWVAGETYNPHTILMDYFTFFENVLNQEWVEETKQEVKTLFKALISEVDVDVALHKKLFTAGSQFINYQFGISRLIDTDMSNEIED